MFCGGMCEIVVANGLIVAKVVREVSSGWLEFT